MKFRCVIVMLLALLLFNGPSALAQQGGELSSPTTATGGSNVLELPPQTSHQFLGIWGEYMHISATFGTKSPLPPTLLQRGVPSSLRFVLTPAGRIAVKFNVEGLNSSSHLHSKAWNEEVDQVVVEVELTEFDPTVGSSSRHVHHMSFKLLNKDSMHVDWFQGAYSISDGSLIKSITLEGTLGRITEARELELDKEVKELACAPNDRTCHNSFEGQVEEPVASPP